MIWRGDQRLILASQSKARRQILEGAGLAFDTMPADVDERSLQQSSGLAAAGKIAELLAHEKARHVSQARPGQYVIGADQTLSLETNLFSKPADRARAAEQLKMLSGNTHELHSSVAVALDGEIVFGDIGVARMTMRPLGDAQIAAYLDAAGDDVLASVGAYQLEKLGIHLFEKIDGDHFTILGLPLLPLLTFFRSRNLLAT